MAYLSSTSTRLIPLADPEDFDLKCDQALPLETMIAYDPKLRKLFEDIDRSRVRVWALTNAYRFVNSHGTITAAPS